MTKVEKYHHILHCQNNLVTALLEQKSQFISEECNMTVLINKWDDVNISPTQLDYLDVFCQRRKVLGQALMEEGS